MEHYGIMGHWQEMWLVAEELRQLSCSPQASPLIHLAYLFRVIETHDFLRDSWQDAFGRLQKAIGLAQDLGLHIHLGIIFLHGIWIAFEMENTQLVSDFIQRMEQIGATQRRIGRMFCHELKALYHLQTGELFAADQESASAVEAAVGAGVPIHEAYSRTTRSYVLRRMGRADDAHIEIEQAETIAGRTDITHVLYLIRLTQASLCLDRKDKEGAARALREAFRIGRNKGYAVTLFKFWQPDEMARLCQEAIFANIETEYAIELIGRHHLLPTEGRPEELSRWPWPITIRTLGGFDMMAAGASGTTQMNKRPLALLKVLISMGGDEVRQEAIEDELWPEADGDMARTAFKTNLSRLRKALGEKAIGTKEGKVSLNPHMVWLDLWALESLSERVSELYLERQGSADEAERLARLALDIYRGDFLASDDEPWIEPARRRLRNTFGKTLQRLGQILTDAGEDEKALRLHECVKERGVAIQRHA